MACRFGKLLLGILQYNSAGKRYFAAELQHKTKCIQIIGGASYFACFNVYESSAI